jgi:chaperonin GroES
MSPKKATKKGTVVAVENGTKEHTMTVKLWFCLYGKYAGTELEGKDYLIMREDDIYNTL